MSIYALPGATFEAALDGAPTGLTGTLGVRILDTPAGTSILARTTAGIVEQPAGSGLYAVALTAPSTAGTYSVVWDTGGGSPTYAREDLVVTVTIPAPVATSGPSYTTPDAVRSELGVDSTTLTDDAAGALILTAEDLVDGELGGRWVDQTTGRKVVAADIDAWRWNKLSRATTLLAARIYSKPDLLEPRYRSVSGPDFSQSGPTGQALMSAPIEALLNASGLRRLGGRARGGPSYRGWRGTLQDDGTWDDEPAWDGSSEGAFG
jgi:hypothetical protein